MKRVALGIAAALYLAACWAPQLWTGTADGQEEIRARRFVLVDEDGAELAKLEAAAGGAMLTLHGADGARLLASPFAGVTINAPDRSIALSTDPWPGLILTEQEEGEARSSTTISTTIWRMKREAPGHGVSERTMLIEPDGLTFSAEGKLRALVGSHIEDGGSTRREGAFVSYDANGNVLWMEPR